jgi:hypothetical protein
MSWGCPLRSGPRRLLTAAPDLIYLESARRRTPRRAAARRLKVAPRCSALGGPDRRKRRRCTSRTAPLRPSRPRGQSRARRSRSPRRLVSMRSRPLSSRSGGKGTFARSRSWTATCPAFEHGEALCRQGSLRLSRLSSEELRHASWAPRIELTTVRGRAPSGPRRSAPSRPAVYSVRPSRLARPGDPGRVRSRMHRLIISASHDIWLAAPRGDQLLPPTSC